MRSSPSIQSVLVVTFLLIASLAFAPGAAAATVDERSLTVTFTVTNPAEQGSYVVLDVTPPDGFSYASHTVATVYGDVEMDTVELDYTQSKQFFMEEALSGGEEIQFSVTYQLDDSVETGTYEFGLHAEGGEHESDTVHTAVVSEPPSESSTDDGDSGSNTDDSGSDPTSGDSDGILSLSVTPASGTVQPGDTVVVDFALENTGSSDQVVGLNVTATPDGWAIASHADDGGSWVSKQEAWFWTSPLAPNDAVEPTIVLSVPEDASPGLYAIGASAESSGGNEVSTIATVSVAEPDSEPAPTAVEAIAGEDGTVQFVEVLEAIAHFNEGTTVDGTDGDTVTFEDVLRIISLFNTGESVSGAS